MRCLCAAFVCLLLSVAVVPSVAQGGPGTITTFAGGVGDGGPAAQASLNRPSGVAVDAKGNVYIADWFNHLIRRVGPDGIITTFAGSGPTGLYLGGFSGDGGPAAQARLNFPADVTVDAKGVVYIADVGNYRIRRVGLDGIITTFAGTGTEGFSGDGGPATQANLNYPADVTVDAKGVVYIADEGNHRIRRVGLDGIITTFAGTGVRGFSGDGGPAAQASLASPYGVAVDAKGVVYIADAGNYRIRRVGLDGVITTFAGTGTGGFSGDGGPAAQALLNRPFGVAVDTKGVVYIADTESHRIRRVGTDGIIMTFAGSGPTGPTEWQGSFSGDGGPAAQARLNFPRGVTVDDKGNIYIADRDNHRIRRVGPDGIITTFAGTGKTDFSGDGGPAAQARLMRPSGVAVDAKEVVYIADSGNDRIRRVGPDGVITTFAGSGPPEPFGRGFSGDGGPAAQARLFFPMSTAVDAKGGVYIADQVNHRVRRVGPDGVITTFAGSGPPEPFGRGFSGDGGPAAQARLNFPRGVAVDDKGNIYIADRDNHRIRRVGPNEIITTIAGGGGPSLGDGGPAVQARLNFPAGVAVDAKGVVYIADTFNHRIRRVGPDRIITTVAGRGTAGFSGDGGPAVQAQLNLPSGVAVDAKGNVYIADSNNHRIRLVSPDGIITTFAGSGPIELWFRVKFWPNAEYVLYSASWQRYSHFDTNA